MAYKIYTKGNYFFVVDDNNRVRDGLAKDVKVSRSNTSATSFRISGLTRLPPFTYDISDLTDENGVAYTSASFIDFYENNTGENAKDGITLYDSVDVDAFGRLRVSDPSNRMDIEFIYDKQNEIVDEVVGGSGTATHVANTRGVTLANGGATTGDYAGLYTYDVPYTPGNSQLVEITGALDFADIGSGTAQIFLRTKVSGSVIETVTDQTSWSINTVSDVDWSLTHIFAIDFQSLKVGRIRFAMVREGIIIPVHTITNDNVRNTGYWQLANHPVYWRVYNDATYTYLEVGYGDTDNAVGFRYRIAVNGSATMSAICGTVKSEGSFVLTEMPGYPRSISNGTTTKTVSTTLLPLLSIRPRSTFNSITNKGLALPLSFSIQTDNPIRLVIYHDNTLTGASWSNVDTTQSFMEYDVTASALTNGHVVFTDYIATAKNTPSGAGGILGRVPLWYRRGTESGILTIAAIRTSGTDATVLASLNWKEIR